METVYEEYLPKGARPWVYLNLSMPGKNIDVNVHPTKMEVQFLHDERIYEMIKKKMDMFLIPTKEDRTMTVVPTFLSNHETSVIDLNESRNSRRSDPNSSDYQVSLALFTFTYIFLASNGPKRFFFAENRQFSCHH